MNAQRPGTRPFPMPVVTLGPGSQIDEEEGTLDYLVMPQGMDTYATPILPEPEDLAGHDAALEVFRKICERLALHLAGKPSSRLVLDRLAPGDLALVNQILGEGEVGARIAPAHGRDAVRAQESVFAGVWRVVQATADGRITDAIEVGACPVALVEAARAASLASDGDRSAPAAPSGLMNAPSILAEIDDARANWRAGQAAHVVNLTLLPMSAEDASHIDRRLGAGPVTILSRGYGNCRIASTLTANVWRVVYYNSQDAVILDSIEVVDIPEVACAADEDLRDSLERLTEVMQWVQKGV